MSGLVSGHSPETFKQIVWLAEAGRAHGPPKSGVCAKWGLVTFGGLAPTAAHLFGRRLPGVQELPGHAEGPGEMLAAEFTSHKRHLEAILVSWFPSLHDPEATADVC
ncbi:uncharacterized protein MAM_08261 [Metarhizium album ARSEF 1941]|uniref:Uncharacterized protein n=1 Tax=Metarhizium album (strain ARSEF 1941) TaxID=1081103 RepID=A0A0B2WDG7_METAS|nr:uncharacterized protein MAM_08261 [Metarhizium album ARSEF 1941]KHN93901.1 hypothetical protein MAM_08261 [Metarhizium album ARSEF 1941]